MWFTCFDVTSCLASLAVAVHASLLSPWGAVECLSSSGSANIRLTWGLIDGNRFKMTAFYYLMSERCFNSIQRTSFSLEELHLWPGKVTHNTLSTINSKYGGGAIIKHFNGCWMFASCLWLICWFGIFGQSQRWDSHCFASHKSQVSSLCSQVPSADGQVSNQVQSLNFEFRVLN